jgi:hypothetical protein
VIQFLLNGMPVRRMAEVMHERGGLYHVRVDTAQPLRFPKPLLISGKPLCYPAAYLGNAEV